MSLYNKIKKTLFPKVQIKLDACDLMKYMSTRVLIHFHSRIGENYSKTKAHSVLHKKTTKEFKRRARAQWELPQELLALEAAHKYGFSDYSSWYEDIKANGRSTHLSFGNYYNHSGKTIGISVDRTRSKPYCAFLLNEGCGTVLEEKSTHNIRTAIKFWKKYINQYGDKTATKHCMDEYDED